MDNNEIKNDIKKLAKDAEVKLTEFLLRWQERREGKDPSDAEVLDQKSRVITDKANEILKRRGKTILKDFKDVYIKREKGEDDKD